MAAKSTRAQVRGAAGFVYTQPIELAIGFQFPGIMYRKQKSASNRVFSPGVQDPLAPRLAYAIVEIVNFPRRYTTPHPARGSLKLAASRVHEGLTSRFAF
jgi:hypothetical protein